MINVPEISSVLEMRNILKMSSVLELFIALIAIRQGLCLLLVTNVASVNLFQCLNTDR